MCILFALSFIAVCPGWFFRPHYFQFLFIPAALLMAYALVNYGVLLGKFAQKISRSRFLAFSLLLTFAVQAEYFVLKSPDYVCSTVYSGAFFPEKRQIGSYLKSQAKPYEYVGQMTHEPQIWFHSQTTSTSGFLYIYPLIENHKYGSQMIEQYIKENEAHHPNWFVYRKIYEENENPESTKWLDSWAKFYLKDFEINAVLYKKDEINGILETNVSAIDTTRELLMTVYKRK